MAQKDKNKKTPAVQKSFMTVGPTLHYSHSNVLTFWALALGVYILSWLFWAKINTGNLFAFPENWAEGSGLWRLGPLITSPLSIFEYPEQIIVLGFLMGLLAVIPILIAQLLSFRFSVPFILAAMFLGLPVLFAASLLISCFGAACRPLRFRSRIIAIALCLGPQILYWGLFGGIGTSDPVMAGFSYSPWILAWVAAMAVASGVLGIGHFTRYRPGLPFTFNLIFLIGVVWYFQGSISLAELDYQLYVANNNPQQVEVFHDHSITDALDATIADERTRAYLKSFFYPEDAILLREVLKREIQSQLQWDRWPNWFIIPKELRYQQKRDWLLEQYQKFIDPPRRWWMPKALHLRFKHSKARAHRMPIALYYKAIVNDMRPDIRLIGQRELLRFYDNYPYPESLPIWHRLYGEFGNSPESIEARRRVAIGWARRGKFERADELCVIALKMIDQKSAEINQNADIEVLSSVFERSPGTVMTEIKFEELKFNLRMFRALISVENRGPDEKSRKLLEQFVGLDAHSAEYADRLEQLLAKTAEDDPLRDNILLAKIFLIEDSQLRAEQLWNLWQTHSKTDSGIRALYELGMLRVQLRKELPAEDEQAKKRMLLKATEAFNKLIELYPNSFLSREATKQLAALPKPIKE